MTKPLKQNLSRIDLNLLTALEALLEERSVTRAASRLFIGQPAMSHHLSRLRELFDDPLLMRQGSQMKLTRRARELAPKVKKILDQVRNDLLLVQEFDPASFDGHLNIGLTDCLYLKANNKPKRGKRTWPPCELSMLMFWMLFKVLYCLNSLLPSRMVT